MHLKQFFPQKVLLRNEEIKMKVSVAMATYNEEEYISKQLDSIITQSLHPHEIVVSDDCSSDGTVDVLNSYSGKYTDISWKTVTSESNSGYIKNFANAIRNTSGDIIILSDQDDIWDIDKVKFVVSEFAAHEDMLSLHTDYAIIDQEGKPLCGQQIRAFDSQRAE